MSENADILKRGYEAFNSGDGSHPRSTKRRVSIADPPSNRSSNARDEAVG